MSSIRTGHRLARTAAGENTIRAYFGRGDNGVDAGWVLRDGVNTYGGVVTGGTGSGKTHAVSVIATAAGIGDDVEVWDIDPIGVASPTLQQYADYAASSRDAIASAVEQARLLIAERAVHATRSKRAFTPSREGRMVLIVVHSAQHVFGDLTDEWADIARLGRMAGVAVVADTQTLTLDAFGGSNALRSALLEGNLLALPNAGMNPFVERSALPREVGHGLLSTPLDRTHRPVRVYFPVDFAGYAQLRRQ